MRCTVSSAFVNLRSIKFSQRRGVPITLELILKEECKIRETVRPKIVQSIILCDWRTMDWDGTTHAINKVRKSPLSDETHSHTLSMEGKK